ncbi:hypothetical protein B0O99DRAFT_681355 [Bisporella sp. PMI_857]|nr:hypothetical protein B0O99DRAFT_681355 [Bisporella sp. PMI_857]
MSADGKKASFGELIFRPISKHLSTPAKKVELQVNSNGARSMQPDHHTHKEVSIYSEYGDIVDGTLWTTSSHAPEYLAACLIAQLRRRPEKLKEVLRDHLSKPEYRVMGEDRTHFTSDDLPVAEYIDYYYAFFDDFFFNGCLKKRCVIEKEKDLDEDKFIDRYTIRAATRSNGDITTKIIIYKPYAPIYDRKMLLLWYLSVLVHEMIRVFIMTFTCRHPDCLVKGDGTARLGYSEIWQEAAYEFEKAALEVLELPLDLLRKWSWVVELLSRDHSKSPVENIRQWGFKDNEILLLIRDFSAEDIRDAREGRNFINWAGAKGYSEQFWKRSRGMVEHNSI